MYLIIKGRNEAVKSLQLDADRSTWLIGRESACDIVLNSSQISRRHAKIICEGEQYFIEDCGSTLGTFIGNARINDRESISVGHQIRIGSYELLLSQTETLEKAEEEDHTSYTQVDATLRGNMMQGKLLHEYKNANLLYTDEMMALKRRIHERVLTEMHLVDMKINVNEMQKLETRKNLVQCPIKVLTGF